MAMFAIGITPGRAEKLRFTQPHLASDIYAVASKTNRHIKEWADIDKAESVVAVAKGTLHEPVMRDKLKAAQLLVLDTPFAGSRKCSPGAPMFSSLIFPIASAFLPMPIGHAWCRRQGFTMSRPMLTPSNPAMTHGSPV